MHADSHGTSQMSMCQLLATHPRTLLPYQPGLRQKSPCQLHVLHLFYSSATVATPVADEPTAAAGHRDVAATAAAQSEPSAADDLAGGVSCAAVIIHAVADGAAPAGGCYVRAVSRERAMADACLSSALTNLVPLALERMCKSCTPRKRAVPCAAAVVCRTSAPSCRHTPPRSPTSRPCLLPL